MADLASMLPGPRAGFGDGAAPAPPPPPAPTGLQEMPSIGQAIAGASDADRRRERRRLAQLSPGEGRNSRGASATGEGDAMTSPTRATSNSRLPSAGGVDSDVDMTRYGLAAEDSPVPRGRRRMSAAGQGGAVTPSDGGSELGSPARGLGSRTDMRSSYDSLDSFSAAGAQGRSTRRGSGFKKKVSKGGAAPGKQQQPQVQVADLHFIGEIVGGSGFSAAASPMLFCRWQLLYEPSKSWQVVRGLQQGATHACRSDLPEEDLVVWEHPLDMHLRTHSLQGWPVLLLMVYARDESANRDSFVSYALVNLPTQPGTHHLSCHTWFAVESNRALGRSFFGWHTGLIPRLEDETFITDLRKREDAGPFICTVGAGTVHLRLSLLTRNLENVTHQGGESLAAALERLTTNILRQSTQLANKAAALEEHRRAQETMTEGQKLVRAGREERFAAARAAVDGRRRGGEAASPLPSESSRTSMFQDKGRAGSFRGFAAALPSPSPRADDLRSEASFGSRTGGPTPPRDRYADRVARRKAAKEAPVASSQEGTPSAGGADGASASGAAAAEGGSRPLSRAPSTSGGTAAALARAASRRAASQSGAGDAGGDGGAAAGGRRPTEDDGLEEIGADEPAAGGGGGGGAGRASEDGGGRAAARAARRAQQKLAF
ncbi:hypothetical protein HYH02_005553 [Chlamydomonas schloesseri]|uniref:B9 domain-containing protein 2 n=1 Tax=Chlamydomonas schloesseri TaxID=2026947 RepID=A0A835WLF4_9CHLO|nr:hypothetical protein HYH02_005553 [Chlamydomonas schloesseri]|eukprot:KAG2449404.1 hypothetical protein HYH02_005553 [Chlamydomonas schloesseri]